MIVRLAITVTDDHIANGVRASSNRCPIALAMCEVLKPDFLCVSDNFVSIGPNTRGVDPSGYPLTDEMREFVHAVDCGLEVHPVTFFLDVQTEAPR